VGAKTKISVMVDDTLLREVDKLAHGRKRSEVFENALAAWVRRHRQVQLDQAIEAYYRTQSARERGEDQSWAALGDEAVRREWGD
jgi:metal-responsive CopG/Arc/MetJ family transcriptional regulator